MPERPRARSLPGRRRLPWRLTRDQASRDGSLPRALSVPAQLGLTSMTGMAPAQRVVVPPAQPGSDRTAAVAPHRLPSRAEAGLFGADGAPRMPLRTALAHRLAPPRGISPTARPEHVSMAVGPYRHRPRGAVPASTAAARRGGQPGPVRRPVAGAADARGGWRRGATTWVGPGRSAPRRLQVAPGQPRWAALPRPVGASTAAPAAGRPAVSTAPGSRPGTRQPPRVPALLAGVLSGQPAAARSSETATPDEPPDLDRMSSLVEARILPHVLALALREFQRQSWRSLD